MKNFKLLFDERGSGLTYVMGIIVVMSVAGLTLSKKTVLMGEQGQRELFKANRDSLSTDLNTFFSSRANCEKYFNTATYTGGTVNYSLSSLASSLQSNEKIVYPKVTLEMKDLKSVTGLSSSPTENIVRTMTSLEYKVNGKTNTETEGLSTDDAHPLTIPIVFEFAKNSAGQWKFYSCYSKDATQFTSQVACESLGGIYNSKGDCRLERKTYNAALNAVEVTTDHNLQDVLCEIEKNVDKQKQINNSFLNNNMMGISSKYCPTPKWNGCRIGQPPNEAWTGNTVKLKPNRIEHYVKAEMELSNMTRFARATHVMDITANGNNVSYQNAVSTGNVSVGSSTGSTNAMSLGAGAAYYASTAQAIAYTTSSTALYASGASSFLGSTTSTVWTFGPYAPLIAIGIAIAFQTILKCDDARKLTPKYTCVNGFKELESIRMEKKKFKCKSFSCGCKWRHEETFDAPTIAEIAKSISSNVKFDDMVNAGTISVTEAEEAGQEILALIESINKRLDGDSVTVQIEIPEDESNPGSNGLTDPLTQNVTYGGIQNLTDFYALHTDIYDSANNRFGFEEFYQMDLDGNPSVLSDIEKDVNNAITALKSRVNNDEVGQWNDLISDVNSMSISTSSLSKLDNYCQEYIDNKDKVHYSGANSKPSAVKSRINSKSLYTTLISQKQTLIASLQAQISAATNPITITNLTNQKTAAENDKSTFETKKAQSPCAAIAGISY